jgi:hypothetical protein
MLTIIWNPRGFYVVDRLPNDMKMNSAYFVTNVLILLEEAIFPQGRALRERWLVIHLDNCSIHTSRVSTDWLEEHDIFRMPQPLYSSDLPYSDFYLFPIVKEKLERIQLADENQFLSLCKLFWVVSITKNWMPYFRLGWGELEKWVKIMEATSDDKKYIYISSAHSHQTGLVHALIDQTIFTRCYYPFTPSGSLGIWTGSDASCSWWTSLQLPFRGEVWEVDEIAL